MGGPTALVGVRIAHHGAVARIDRAADGPAAVRPHGHPEQRDDEPDAADDHQDHADRVDVDAVRGGGYRELQDRPDGDQEQRGAESHSFPPIAPDYGARGGFPRLRVLNQPRGLGWARRRGGTAIAATAASRHLASVATIRTLQRARCETWFGTLPRLRRLAPCIPWLPTTIRLAETFSATRSRASAGS